MLLYPLGAFWGREIRGKFLIFGLGANNKTSQIMTISNLTKKHRVYPTLDYNGKSETYLNMRVVDRQNSNKTIEVPVFKPNGVRVKVISKCLSDGKIMKGFYDDAETSQLNDLLLDNLLRVYLCTRFHCSKPDANRTGQKEDNGGS
jgi:hypothetical protein